MRSVLEGTDGPLFTAANGRRLDRHCAARIVRRAGIANTMRYDRARTSLDRHATYIVATYVAGAAR